MVKFINLIAIIGLLIYFFYEEIEKTIKMIGR